MYNTSSYNTVSNRPIECTFCGTPVNGRIVENKTSSNTNEKLCKWICTKCGNLVKVGKLN